MESKRIEIKMFVSPQEAKALDKLAAKEGRSRKNLCEYLVKNYIESLLDKQAKK